jgi:hypothetical protein
MIFLNNTKKNIQNKREKNRENAQTKPKAPMDRSVQSVSDREELDKQQSADKRKLTNRLSVLKFSS